MLTAGRTLNGWLLANSSGADWVVCLGGAEKYRIALMCAETEPLDCHRTILVCRHLKNQGVNIKHILGTGSIEEHQETEKRLLKISGVEPSLFDNADSELERLDRAYRKRGGEIAYRRKG